MTEQQHKALSDWIRADGPQAVADALGASVDTVGRWAGRLTKPRGMALQALTDALERRKAAK